MSGQTRTFPRPPEQLSEGVPLPRVQNHREDPFGSHVLVLAVLWRITGFPLGKQWRWKWVPGLSKEEIPSCRRLLPRSLWLA